MSKADSSSALAGIHRRVVAVENHVDAFQAAHRSALEPVHPDYRASAENLLAYVGLRQLDLRALQLKLGTLGVSSLGRCEGHVRSSIQALRCRLEDSIAARGGSREPFDPVEGPALSWATAKDLLHAHTQALLGPRPSGRHVMIMVTAPDLVAPTELECVALLEAGMNVLRINTAHGTAHVWRQTAGAVRQAAMRLQKPVRILVDLEGPKL